MNSMTGYGFKETIVDGTQISVEIKSVNSRFLDLAVNMPPFLNPLEKKIRALVSEKVLRGKVDVNIRIKDLSSNAKVIPDFNAARIYYNAFSGIASALELKKDDIPLSLIVNQDGVLTVTHEYDADSYWKKISATFDEVLSSFCDDRKREGENLRKDLLLKIAELKECADFFKKMQPKMEKKFKETVTQKFKEITGEYADENRIMQEVAAMVVKYTINEEIVRLFSHLESLENEIKGEGAPGKRLDFICQEANREINTIGSKNQSVEIAKAVIRAKDALENIREQSKNVE